MNTTNLNSLDDFIKYCKHLIASNKIDELFSKLRDGLYYKSAVYNEIILLQSRYSSALKSEMRGIVTPEFDSVLNTIRHGLISIIDQFTTEDLSDTYRTYLSIEDNLDILAKNIKISIPITPVHLVNCNRHSELTFFRRKLEEWHKKTLPVQFYFILACPTQEPEGFAERLVYELLADFELSEHKSVYYSTFENNGRIKVDRLPTGQTLEFSKIAFKSEFSKRFMLGTQSFEDYLSSTLSELNYDHIIISLSIPASLKRDTDLMEKYLQWLIDVFSNASLSRTKMMFFFSIPLKYAHVHEKIDKSDREVVKSIQRLKDNNEKNTLLFSALPPVKARDFEEWLEDLGQIPQYQKDNIIQTISKRFNSEEKLLFDSVHSPINMEHIEDFQERVFKFHA